MAPEPSEPSGQAHDAAHDADAPGASPPPPAAREAYGELEIERHVKGDGRALILYFHRRAQAETGQRR